MVRYSDSISQDQRDVLTEHLAASLGADEVLLAVVPVRHGTAGSKYLLVTTKQLALIRGSVLGFGRVLWLPLAELDEVRFVAVGEDVRYQVTTPDGETRALGLVGIDDARRVMGRLLKTLIGDRARGNLVDLGLGTRSAFLRDASVVGEKASAILVDALVTEKGDRGGQPRWVLSHGEREVLAAYEDCLAIVRLGDGAEPELASYGFDEVGQLEIQVGLSVRVCLTDRDHVARPAEGGRSSLSVRDQLEGLAFDEAQHLARRARSWFVTNFAPDRVGERELRQIEMPLSYVSETRTSVARINAAIAKFQSMQARERGRDLSDGEASRFAAELGQLAELRQNEVITQEEYLEMRASLVRRFGRS